ncbi:hypothetical protein BD408DRAFT_425776 [Parasitella parasitica]|nr:hypothetical protein BD408DRAFT_425776 [Parasitella parasitica]
MVKFSANSLTSGACELDDLIFKNGQNILDQELESFVQEFETRQQLLTADSLAKTFVNITACDLKLKAAAAATADLSPTQQKINDTQKTLNRLMEAVKETQNKHSNLPFEAEKQAYLKLLQERKKKLEQDIRRESDILDENYAKKTRESIYRNLVGSQDWFKS